MLKVLIHSESCCLALAQYTSAEHFHFIRYSLLALDGPPFCHQKLLNYCSTDSTIKNTICCMQPFLSSPNSLSPAFICHPGKLKYFVLQVEKKSLFSSNIHQWCRILTKGIVWHCGNFLLRIQPHYIVLFISKKKMLFLIL